MKKYKTIGIKSYFQHILKNENGGITILVLVSILFMISFLITSYVITANKVQTQKEIIQETRKIYESQRSMEEIYNSYFDQYGIIPIYTAEQLMSIGSNELICISEANGKYYTFSNDAIYILMNDIECEQDEISKSFEGKLEDNNHIITIINNDEECICNRENNFNGILINLPEGYEDTVSNIVDEVPIPNGFRYVKGTKDTGLVITDAYSGLEDEGNEFVWIPVEDINDFTRTTFNSDNLANNSSTVGGYWIDETTDEYTSIVSSIDKYKGFYFGRFETSKIPNIQENIAQIKRNADPWVDIIDSAQRKANSMYDSNNDYYDYISTHLVYPQEWDTALNWIIATETKTTAEVTQDSSSWGNYNVIDLVTNNIKQTGSSEDYVANNIYDLAGNVSEITMEQKYIALGSNYVSIRGGNYKQRGSNAPASNRDGENDAKNYLGFRICMIINE